MISDNNYVVQNSLCFVGNAPIVDTISIKSLLNHMIDDCRVEKIYFSFPSPVLPNLYKIVTSIRKHKKRFSRIIVSNNSNISKVHENIFNKFEDYVHVDSSIIEKYDLSTDISSPLYSEIFAITLSTYVIFLSNDLSQKDVGFLYNFAQKLGKEIIFLS